MNDLVASSRVRAWMRSLVATALLALLAVTDAAARELRDYTQFNQTLGPAVQTLAPGTELTAPATVGQTSKPLLTALQQRFYSLEGRTPAPATPFASFTLAAVEDSSVQPTSNIWVAGSRTWLKDSTPLVDYGGDQTAVTVGTDHKFSKDLVIGVAATRENLDISTHFNAGHLESKGVTVAPYLVWTIGGPFSLDATAGYTRSDIDQTYGPAVVPGGVHASTHSHRALFAGNLNYTSFVDDWIVGGKVGTLMVAERIGSYTDSAGFTYDHMTNTLGQLQVGPNIGRIASWGTFGVAAAYLYDYNHLERVSPPGGAPPPIDRDGVLLTGNISASVTKSVAVNLTVSREYLRDNVHNTNVAAMLAVSF